MKNKEALDRKPSTKKLDLKHHFIHDEIVAQTSSRRNSLDNIVTEAVDSLTIEEKKAMAHLPN